MKGSTKDKSKSTRIVGIINLLILLIVMQGCTAKPVQNEPKVSNLEFIDSLRDEYTGEGEYIKVRVLGMMKDSLQEGLWVAIYPNNMIESIAFYEKGEKNGPRTVYRKSGQKLFYREFKDGIEHGRGYNWYENGKLANTMNFVHEKLDGITEDFDEEGNLISSHEYKDGEYIRTIYGIPLLIDETAE